MKNSDHDYSLSEYVNIDEHIAFAESLINKYDWQQDVHTDLTSLLTRIKNKQKDEFLNLSVIGEFSTGKSSFINALLGVELLVSSAIQGTTVVNTVIEYYPEPLIFVQKKDGRYEMVEGLKVDQLSQRLSDLTTNPKTARNIRMVRVGLPCEVLKNGIRIIDTPGTNSVDSWHEDVTKEALSELSDLSIVLTDGIHPMSQTLIEFVEENLADIYSQCAFVTTYYDKIRRNEREQVLAFIRKKLTDDLDIAAPQVFPFVAPALLAERTGQRIIDDQDEMVRISLSSRKAIFELMEKKRQIAQIKKLLTLTKLIYASLFDNIDSRKQLHELEYELLLKTKQVSLDPFIQAEKTKRSRAFEYSVRDIRDVFADQIARDADTAKANIRSAIINSKGVTADDIKSFISNNVPELCKKEAEKLARKAAKLSEPLTDELSAVLREFQGEFKKQFKKLGIISVNLDNVKIKSPDKVEIPITTLESSLQYMSQEVSKENWMMGGGGVAGAAIGTAICPGIGTVIGGLLGSFIGAMNTPSSDQIKKNACDKLSVQLDSAFRTLESECLSAFDRNVTNHRRSIKTEIDRYLQKYKATVDQMIEDHNRRIAKSEQEISKVNNDLNILSLRREQLKSISDNLSNLQK